MKDNRKRMWDVTGFGKNRVMGRLVVARTYDDDCWNIMVQGEDGEIYLPLYEGRDTINPMSIDKDIAYYNSDNAKVAQKYMKGVWDIYLPIVWGSSHTDRFWSWKSGRY